MDRQVRLTVAIQIECAQCHAAFHRILENSGEDIQSSPVHFPRKPDVQGN